MPIRFESIPHSPALLRTRLSARCASIKAWTGGRSRGVPSLRGTRKHLSVTKALIDQTEGIAGYFTLATGQVDFSDLPTDLARRLPRRTLPVAILAWLGVSKTHQGQGLGRLLLAQSLLDCHEAGKTFAFIAVILDCINDESRSFYQKWDFQALPGSPYRLYLSAKQLEAMIQGP